MVPMAKDNQIAVRFNDPTYEAIQKFAENKDYSQAEAVRRCTESRLAGEGYLDGPAVADGGEVVEKIDELDQQLDHVDQHLANVDKEIEHQNRLSIFVNAFALLGIIWIGVNLTVGFSPFWGLATGIPLIVGLGFFIIKLWVSDEDE